MTTLIGDIEWYRGDSYPLELTIKDQVTGEVIDLTGFSFMLSVNSLRDPPDASTLIFNVAGVLDADPLTGKVTFTPTSTHTGIDPKVYYYDVQMTNTAGDIRTIVKHKWRILQDITK